MLAKPVPGCEQRDAENLGALCYAIVLPCRTSGCRAGLWPDCCREGTEIGPSAGRRANLHAFPVAVRQKSGTEVRFTAWKHAEMWGASPPNLWRAFPGPRGRPDLKNTPKQIRPDCLQVPRSQINSEIKLPLGYGPKLAQDRFP